MMDISIRQARPDDTKHVSQILSEAARWLEKRGLSLWKSGEVSPSEIKADVEAGRYFVASVADEPAGTMKYELEDLLFWPDHNDERAAYIHRLAVKRLFAGGLVSTALMEFAAEHARIDGRNFLRLDCDSSRLRLRAVYERFGFMHHSDRVVGPYHISRYELAL